MSKSRLKANPVQDRLLRIQRKIYRSLGEQAEQILGNQPEPIRQYEREYLSDFRKLSCTIHPVERDALIDEVRASDITLIGDFHTFSQAQRTALRILRAAFRGEGNWHLCLEIFPSHRQEILDRFQRGEIDEAEFLEEIRYHEWGFAWEQYAPLVRWAIQNGVKLVALNRPEELNGELGSDLAARDRWAAGVLTDLFLGAGTERPRAIVLYGEHHIGRKHLPAEIERVSREALKSSLRTSVIHQNQESIYWKAARLELKIPPEVLKIGRRTFCVMSGTPWNKLQSVINWAEGPFPSAEKKLGDAPRDTDESDLDALGSMKIFIAHQAQFFGIPEANLDSLHALSIADAGSWERSLPTPLPLPLRRLLNYHILHNQRLYLPGIQPLAYLASPSENGMAELAAIHLMRSRRTEDPFFEGTAADFYRWVLDFAFGFLGSLVLNPRRKCDLVADHRAKVGLKEARLAFPHEFEARCFAIEWTLKPEAGLKKLESLLSRRTISLSLFFGAKFLGQALAKSLHMALIEGRIPLAEVRHCFFGDLEGAEKNQPAFWRYSQLKRLSMLATTKLSKNENL